MRGPREGGQVALSLFLFCLNLRRARSRWAAHLCNHQTKNTTLVLLHSACLHCQKSVLGVVLVIVAGRSLRNPQPIRQDVRAYSVLQMSL